MSNSQRKTNREFLLGIFLPIVILLLLSIPVLFVALFVSKTFLNILVGFLVRLILPLTLAYISYGLMAYEIHKRGTPVDLWADRENQIPVIATYWKEIGRHSRFSVLLILFFLSILFMVSQGIVEALKQEKYGVLVMMACFCLIVFQMYLFARRIKKRPNAISGSTFYNHKVFFVFLLSVLIISFITLLYLYSRYTVVNPRSANIIVDFVGPILLYLETAYFIYFITHLMFEGYTLEDHSIILPMTKIIGGLIIKKKITVAFEDIEKIRIINNPTGHCDLTVFLPEYQYSASISTSSKNDFLERIRRFSKKKIPLEEEAFSEERNNKTAKAFIAVFLLITVIVVFLSFVVDYLATMHLQR